MKKLLSTFTVLLLLTGSVTFGQSLQTGIDFYEEGNYDRALQVFANSDEARATLFTGKSYFALNKYLKAKYYLNQIDSTEASLYPEAQYTLALADFQLKNFTAALDRLYLMANSRQQSSVHFSARNFYKDLLSYLSPKQKFEVFKATAHDGLRYELMKNAIGSAERGAAKAFFNAYQQSVVVPDSIELAKLEAMLSDSASYSQQYRSNQYPDAPEGISYTIGVALPEFPFESQEFEISQHLYFGIQLAIENFNSQNNDKKAFISYKNTNSDSVSLSQIAHELVWNDNADAVIGPLFSETAASFAPYAEQYELPMLSPLANSDELNLDYNYTFQMNPTFAVQGETMARFAIRELEYDTMAVIAERGALGEASAQAFLDESRKLGAKIVHYFVEDLSADGYDINQYVEKFDPEVDTLFNYNIDAVYAPFTGNVAGTLINSLVTNLEAIDSEMTILGSAEWEPINLANTGLRNTELYYTETYHQQDDSTTINEFESAFRLRFNTEPNQFAFIGYDAANVLLENIKRVQNPVYLREGLKSFNGYRGLFTNVSFRNTHINQEVKIRKAEGLEEE